MAGPTIHTFDVELSDTRRGAYGPLSFTVARHPSESGVFLATRILAFCLEQQDGLSFSRGGLSDPDGPALYAVDPTGARTAWIEVGLPSAERLHRASKACDRVSVWPHKDVAVLHRQLAGERIHRASEIRIHAVETRLLEWLAERFEKRTRFTLTAAGDELFLELGREGCDGSVATTDALGAAAG